MSRPPTWTIDQLQRVLDEGEYQNWTEVAVALGLGPWAVNRTTVHRIAEEHGWELKRPAPEGADREEGGR